MQKWRIKSEQDFRREGLWDEAVGVPFGWNSKKQMNYLMGKEISPSLSGQCAQSAVITIDNWRIRSRDYILASESVSQAVVTNPIIVKEDNTPRFDLDRLSKEIDTLFQEQLVKAKTAQTETVKEIIDTSVNMLKEYKQRIDALFPDIKERLIEEIQRGHTTIVLQDRSEFPILQLDHPKMKDVVVSLQTQHKAMLVGPAGTGKTYMVAEIAKRLNLPFYKYSCSRDSSVHDLLGYKQPASETYLETVFLQAYEKGGLFLVDEYDAMSGDMALFFNGVADNSKFISVPHRDSKPTAEKHKDFYLIMCGNTWGKGSIDYSGRDFQDMALMDRFRFCRHFIGYHYVLETKWMGRNSQFAIDLRKVLEQVGTYLSTRNIEDLAQLIALGESKTDILNMITQDLSETDKNTVIQRLVNHNLVRNG